MKKAFLILFLMVSYLYMSADFNVKIVSFKNREILLNTAKMYVGDQSVRLKPDLVFEDQRNPFTIKKVEEVKEEVVEPEGESETEANILEKIGKKLNPSGSIEKDGEYILMFGTRFIKNGDSIKAKYKDNIYTVYFDNISEHNFVIKLNDVRLDKEFDSNKI